MSGETLVRLTSDVRLDDPCSTSWTMGGGQTAVNTAQEQSPQSGWGFVCTKHGTQFRVDQDCPASFVEHKSGVTLSVPSKLARHLVEHDVAVYPTHASEPDQEVQATLGRVNALMDAQGLPHMTAEGMGVWKVEGQQQPYQRPAKPRDRRLASDLGLDAADIAAMRDAARGNG